MIVLAGDIGGTNARLGLFRVEGRRPTEVWRGTWPSRAHAGLPEVLARALPALPARPEAAAFGIAGPVVDGVCRATNLPWVVADRDLARTLGLPRVPCLNDLEANAWGLETLAQDDLTTLLPGMPDPRENRALVSAGTGLGEAALLPTEGGWRAVGSEGGHADFAPADEEEVALWRWLAARYGHVSWERVLSGPGLVDIARFLRSTGVGADEPEPAGEGAAAALTAAALDGTSALARATLGRFASLYGAECGNVALRFLARGGVYLGGGIAPRILPWLEDEGFRRAFLGKGRMRPLLETVPVHVVREPDTALRGAALAAASLA